MKKTTASQSQLKVQLARALADYDNLKRRQEREREEILRYANQELIVKLLPVFDLFDKAKTHLEDEGLKIAVSQFKQILREQGVAEVTPRVGERFDEKLHEVVGVVTNPDKNMGTTIAEVVITGFAWENGRLIRPAQVKVYGKPAKQEE